MLKIQFSNRIETLCDAVVDAIGNAPPSPFSAQQIIVPSTAMRRHLTLAVADRYGICANVDCVYLAEWLWRQIARVVPTVAAESPFASSALTWRIYQILQESSWTAFPRLEHYLRDPNDARRFELATELAALFEQYITYRQDWMNAWLHGESIPMPKASKAQLEDQAWQAELWRRVSAQLGTAPEHPAGLFLRSLEAAGSSGAAGANPFDLPSTVHVLCLPAIPPLYLAVLTGLASWIDVTLYVLNPCREYWFDIVDPKRLRALSLRGAATHQESGNGLLASWGKQTKAHIELLLGQASDAPLDDEGFDEHFSTTLLGTLQHAIFSLTELDPRDLRVDPGDRSIEVHVCHSLTRELEVLQDQLLALFAGPSPPRPDDVLIVTPNLDAAAPLIDAVFGNVSADRRLPYAITGRGPSAINPGARALLALLAILPSRFPASALVELLQQPLIGRRFGIGADELPVIEDWLHSSGIRWALDASHREELGVPGTESFTIADGLNRLLLGYALPQHVLAPAFGRVPAGNAEGARAAILGSFAAFVEQLTALRATLREPRLPEAWLEALHALLDSCLAPVGNDLDDLTEVRATLRELRGNMGRGGLEIPVPLAVLRASLEAEFADAARGGVPTGAITFSSMGSLRNLPFRFVGIIGLDDGAFPSAVRPREFDLMTAAPRAGDRQRRLDDRNLFLDLVLAARERLYLSYTGRSIRDNSVRPPSVVLAELIETLLPVISREQLIVEHPLQAFAESYFRDGDLRRRSFNRELCEALRHALAEPAVTPRGAAPPDESELESDGDDHGHGLRPFFAAPLAAPGPEWRRVSLDQLQRFFRNPCQFLLRQRLGMSLYREQGQVLDEEPFTPDRRAERALAERLLPLAIQGLGGEELRGLARAGIEYPPGVLGIASLQDEISSLEHFALEVRNATQTPALPALTVELPFVLEGEDWRIATTITERREAGLILHRYDHTRPTDYLCGWLTHLVAAAASATPTETQWISRDGSFRFAACDDAGSILGRILLLYRRGLSEPLHFFPTSAWEYIRSGRDLFKARAKWKSSFKGVPSEGRHEAYRVALRGIDDPLDADFEVCAETVFGTSRTYLDDPRL